MGNKQINNETPEKKGIWNTLGKLGQVIIVAGVIVGISFTLLEIYYNFTPVMISHTQIYTGANYSVNSCLSITSSFCPTSLTSGQPAVVYFSNIGQIPAVFSVNFSSDSAKISTPYQNTWTVDKDTNEGFSFVPTFTNIISFSIHINATCAGGLLGCINSRISKNCTYTVKNQTASLVNST